MRFAHLADCHIGGWRDPKMQDASTDSFVAAIDRCMERQVDFVLVSGDLFNTAVPSIDKLKVVFMKLDQLRKAGIALYYIAGSHDFSPSGKTMLDLIELAGLGINVMKGDFEETLKLSFTVDQKTGAKITGIFGRKGGLERHYLQTLDKDALCNEDGYKIFMFHTAITELKSKDLEKMESVDLCCLPPGFDYYAGGHVHIISAEQKEGYRIAYPGPIFPNSFSEFEKLGNGGFYLVEDGRSEYISLDLFRHYAVKLDCSGITPRDVEISLARRFENMQLDRAIVTLRLSGQLSAGRPSDINYSEIYRGIYRRGAYFVMKNANKLTSQEFEESKVDVGSAEQIEEDIIEENTGQTNIFDKKTEAATIKSLMKAFSADRKEGEKVADFENRVIADALESLGDLKL